MRSVDEGLPSSTAVSACPIAARSFAPLAAVGSGGCGYASPRSPVSKHAKTAGAQLKSSPIRTTAASSPICSVGGTARGATGVPSLRL